MVMLLCIFMALKKIQACFGLLSALEIKSSSKFRSQVTDKHSKMLRLWQSLIFWRWEIGFLERKEVMNAELKIWVGESKKGTLNTSITMECQPGLNMQCIWNAAQYQGHGERRKPKGWGMSLAAIWAWRNWKTGSQEGVWSFWVLQRNQVLQSSYCS